MGDIGVVIANQPCNYRGDTLAADLPQRIKGRNPNVIERLLLNHSLESLDASLIPEPA